MIGQGHAYALRLLTEDGEVRPVAVTDFSPRRGRSRARASARSNGSATDAQAVIDDPDVEAVVIVTPTTTHRDLVRAVVAAGKPLLCEKPLATRFDVVREMCALVAASGLHRAGRLPLALPSADQRAASRLVSSNELGAPDGLHAARRPVLADRRRRSRPQLVAVATRARGRRRAARALDPQRRHPLVARSGRRARVYARTRNVFGYDVEDTAVVHDRARVGRRRHADLDLQRRARARGTPARGVLRTGRGRGHHRLPRRRARGRLPHPAPRPGTANGSTSARLRDRHFEAAGIDAPRLLRLPVSGRARVRAIGCGTASPASPDVRRRVALRTHSSTPRTAQRTPVSRWS